MEGNPNSVFHPSKWLPKVKGRTFGTELVKVTPEFIAFMQEDGIRIHKKYRAKDDEENEEEQDEEEPAIELVGMDDALDAALEKLNRCCFVKLDGVAPKDAVGWLPGLKASRVEDVLLVLKASDIVGEYFSVADAATQQSMTVVLRKWYQLIELREFRCFVIGGVLAAITQRHAWAVFPEPKATFEEFRSDIKKFYDTIVKGAIDASEYCFDVYVEKREAPYKIWLIDFGPLDFKQEIVTREETDAAIAAGKAPLLKIIEEIGQIRKDRVSTLQVPWEIDGDEDGDVIRTIGELMKNGTAENRELFQ
eukprot:TRINITY_DN7225_c0_g1_i3.p1 TRINITY_DN7225_c0_g1~~TRINITY_DN7225_c0_g1_i3.p1  ORF type:complete len:307 (-),score=65.32 TRINITY_DN7225_c0_g1_i3:102-1022(-)